VAVFAFTVHPDEKDVRVATSKQNILLGALLWRSSGLFLIQAGITIASLTSRGANCTPRRALDLAAVAVRVKSVGRQLAASILFLAMMALADVAGAQDTRNMPDEAKPPQAVLLAGHLSGDTMMKLITQAKTAFDIAFVTVLVAGTAIMLLMAAVIAQIISRAKTPEPSASPGGATTTASDAATP